jgi:hypothetical protein
MCFNPVNRFGMHARSLRPLLLNHHDKHSLQTYTWPVSQALLSTMTRCRVRSCVARHHHHSILSSRWVDAHHHHHSILSSRWVDAHKDRLYLPLTLIELVMTVMRIELDHISRHAHTIAFPLVRAVCRRRDRRCRSRQSSGLRWVDHQTSSRTL